VARLRSLGAIEVRGRAEPVEVYGAEEVFAVEPSSFDIASTPAATT
jgi:hypothetical protein